MQNPTYQKIFLSGENGKGYYALVDAAYYPDLNKRSWHMNKGGYASSQNQLMHRVIAAAYHGEAAIENLIVDHIDGNRLNNTVGNLRIVTSKANAKNRTTKNDGQLYEGVFNYGDQFCTKIKDIIIFVHRDPGVCALCYDSAITFTYGNGKRLNDNHSKAPLPITYWNINPDVLNKLSDIRKKHTDFHGVKSSKGEWRTKITIDLGTFEDVHQAAEANDIACQVLGIKGKVNFPGRLHGPDRIRDVMMRLYNGADNNLSRNSAAVDDLTNRISNLKVSDGNSPKKNGKTSSKEHNFSTHSKNNGKTSPKKEEHNFSDVSKWGPLIYFVEHKCFIGEVNSCTTKIFHEKFWEYLGEGRKFYVKDIKAYMKHMGVKVKRVDDSEHYYGIALRPF